ncbi:hypothetical protein QFZ51_006154 [Chitinophaga sp. W3I9]
MKTQTGGEAENPEQSKHYIHKTPDMVNSILLAVLKFLATVAGAL